MGKSKGNNGSELHRLKPMQEYDEATFNRLYKVCKPVIRNLTRQIDYKRFNLTPDIIQSYFWDKMLFVFNKYYGECTEEHLKARILASLSTFKNKLLESKAYVDLVTKDDLPSIQKLISNLYHIPLSDSEYIKERIYQFSTYVEMKNLNDSFDLDNFEQYEEYSRKIEKVLQKSKPKKRGMNPIYDTRCYRKTV